MGIYKKCCLNFQSIHSRVFLLFCFANYKIVDSEYSMEIYKSVKMSIETVMKNPEVLKIRS